ncbi:MAG: glutamyl-tRNA reductase [Acidobacteria bacterium]|nr:glutamyl-tRNA reductase [Acidobacteriota bacterium]
MEQANNQPILFAFGVNHKTASIQVREKIYVQENEMSELLAKLRETLSECMILSTCNRTEIYGVYPTGEVDFDYYKNLLIDFKNASETVNKEDFFSFISCAACQQLFRVATSVDSKIIGDTQILQQLRHSYALAKDGNYTDKILNQLLQRSLKIGKQTYTQTSIHKGAVSISLAAVDFALKTYGSLNDKMILIVGAGETARLTAECLLKKNVGKILVTNRTKENAKEFLDELHKSYKFESEIIDFENFRDCLNETDIIISSTSSPDYILFSPDFEQQSRKILLIDIALPRNIAPEVAKNEFVSLKNIDDLYSVVDKNFKKRMAEMSKVKKIIYREMGDFLVWYYSLPLLPVSFKSGNRPDDKSIEEFKKVKEFLAANAAWFHRMARQKDVRSELDEHKNLVKQLYAMKQTALGEVKR